MKEEEREKKKEKRKEKKEKIDYLSPAMKIWV